MIILIKCEDKIGLVAAISGLMANEKANIITMREYVDTDEKLFFARLHIESNTDIENLEQKLQNILPQGAEITINQNPLKKIVVLVTKEYHCLSDLLVRNHFQSMKAEIQCVIGNYEVLRDITEKFDIPYIHISTETNDRVEFENLLLQHLNNYTFDYIVLAKFMRILSPNFISHFPMRIINIHHSFLPAFVGASPYKQAHDRGVKIIGATAHYVTDNLDEGPIIAQKVIPINHNYRVIDMVKTGKEVETSVLSYALELILEDRVLVYNNKTVVLI